LFTGDIYQAKLFWTSCDVKCGKQNKTKSLIHKEAHKETSKIPSTTMFFCSPNSFKTALTLLYNKLIFVLVRISLSPKN